MKARNPLLGKNAKWSAPISGVTKINFDAAYDAGSTHAATGVVARISDGEFVLAAARGYDNIQNPLTAETLAFRDAITEAVKEGWQHVHFETACQIGSGEAKENASNLVPLKGDWYCSFTI